MIINWVTLCQGSLQPGIITAGAGGTSARTSEDKTRGQGGGGGHHQGGAHHRGRHGEAGRLPLGRRPLYRRRLVLRRLPRVPEARGDRGSLPGGRLVRGHHAGGGQPRHQGPGQPPDDLI